MFSGGLLTRMACYNKGSGLVLLSSSHIKLFNFKLEVNNLVQFDLKKSEGGGLMPDLLVNTKLRPNCEKAHSTIYST